jgi:hypothetical protein
MQKTNRLLLIFGFLVFAIIMIVTWLQFIMPVGNTSDLSEHSPSLPRHEVLEPSTDNGISREAAERLVPLQPSSVVVEVKDDLIVVRWRGTGEDVVNYEILRRASDVDDWVEIAKVESTEENRAWYEWADHSSISGSSYVYGVRAVSPLGSQSLIAQSSEIIAP